MSEDALSDRIEECRICFSAVSPVRNLQYPSSYRKVLLRSPCACKGSISNVHEACLVKWIQQQNIRKCELCLKPFVLTEEYGSVWQIAKQTVIYIGSSKRRLLRAIIYGIYLYLFCKRFSFVIKYFKQKIIDLFRSLFLQKQKPARKPILRSLY